MTNKRSQKLFEKLAEYYGEPTPGLEFINIYQLAVSVVLSAQTTDKQVNSVTPRLFAIYKDFHSLSQAQITDVESIIKSTGFFRNKAKNIVGLARAVSQIHNGKLPATREELMALPGIGRKSANVILSVGYNIPALAVDTHVLRIANRLGYIQSKNPDQVEKSITATLPESDWKKAHLLLITHGRKTCNARSPLCSSCPILTLCVFEDKNL